MSVSLWRIAADTPRYKAEDLSGKGAAVDGARWNHPGEHVAYASTSIALAAWETRAHIGSAAQLPWNRYLVRIDVPDEVWARRERAESPPVGWDAIPEGQVSRAIGSAWLQAGRSALLIVPSVVVHEEHNVLINPQHPGSAGIVARKVRRFLYDPRV